MFATRPRHLPGDAITTETVSGSATVSPSSAASGVGWGATNRGTSPETSVVLVEEENVLAHVPDVSSRRQMAWGIQAFLTDRREVDRKGLKHPY